MFEASASPRAAGQSARATPVKLPGPMGDGDHTTSDLRSTAAC